MTNSPCRLLLVGEAWGSEEERRSLKTNNPSPFVGKSGWFLRTSLAAAGILPQPSSTNYPGVLGMEKTWDEARALGIYVTNVFQCRPGPGSNDIENLLVDKRKADPAEVTPDRSPLRPGMALPVTNTHHLDRLAQEVTSLQPNLIVLLGATALWAFLDTTAISKARGAIVFNPPLPKILPTYHPAAIFRRWHLRPAFLADLLKAQREMIDPAFSRIDRTIWYEPESVDELWNWWAEHGPSASILSVDIETEAHRWISEVGIAVDETKCLHVPILLKIRAGYPTLIDGTAIGLDRKELINQASARIPKGNKHQLIPYWKTPAEETQAWLFLKHVLEQTNVTNLTPMLGQNFLYDIQYFLRAAPVPGGIRVRGFQHDTMLAHHALYPGMEKSLGFMASVRCNEPGWKDLRKKPTGDENDK